MRKLLALLALLAALVVPALAQQNVPTLNGATTAITGIGTGSTSAVVATLPAAAGKVVYLCGFDVSAAGGTATVSPITVAGLLGGSFAYQVVSAGGAPFGRTFALCVAASGQNTAITVTTTADSTATAVDVQALGFQQ